MDNNNKFVNMKTVRRRRSECSWKKENNNLTTSTTNNIIEYPPGPIHILPSWNPVNRNDKPPYSYATIIGHAILTSKERKLTLNDIYVWITENYPFYSNDTQGWQNSIRHNLSLHKAFVKIERDSTTQTPPRKGCFWTIRPDKEKFFIDNLQRPLNSVRKQQSLSHMTPSSTSATSIARRQQLQRRASTILSTNSSNSNTIHDHHGGGGGGGGLFKTFRTTVTSTTASPTTVPESEQNNNVIISSSSSSDHNNLSPITSHTSSPTYNQLFTMSDSNATYNVYPEENEIFHTSPPSEEDYAYSTTSSSNYHPPSLSPGDTYSTTSSSFADFYPTATSSSTSRSQVVYNTHYKVYPSSYNSPSISNNNNNMMEWSSTTNTNDHRPLLKHDNSFYNSSNTISPPYYYMQQQSRLPGTHSSDFSSFLHR